MCVCVCARGTLTSLLLPLEILYKGCEQGRDGADGCRTVGRTVGGSGGCRGGGGDGGSGGDGGGGVARGQSIKCGDNGAGHAIRV